MSNNKNKYILDFKEIDKNDISLVGGKGANLGEMTAANMPVPPGFVVTSFAYYDFLDENHLREKIKHNLTNLDTSDPQQLNVASHRTKKLVLDGKMSKNLGNQIINSYVKLGGVFKQALVAVRSSATAEDLPTASFAGQQATFLNIKGEANVVEKVKECWASLFEPRAIFYRQENKFDHFKVGIAVPVQLMIPSEVSGVMFTIDPISNQKNRILIEAIWGLGEYIVQGVVSPDQYLVDKNTLEILKRSIEKQTVQLVKAKVENKETGVPRAKQLRRKLNDKQIIELAKIGKKIHDHYYYPQDIEWALYKKKLYLLQTRPVTTITEKKEEPKEIKVATKDILLKGSAASPGLISGKVTIIKTSKEIGKVEKGDILVTSMTTPDFVPAMKKAVAIITDKGGQTSHAAIVSREIGIPCVVGTETATTTLKNNQIVTVNGSKGEVYKGALDVKSKTIEGPPLPTVNVINRTDLIKTATKVYVNLGEPELAGEVAKRHVDGLGLLRAEFMIANIGVHPKKLIKDGKQKQFIDKLAEGMSQFCQAFSPRPVVYRATDFKTNEYRNLVGGKNYEPHEENPFIGYRGAFRYVSDPDVFELELEAVKRVRNKYGFRNLWLMIPFCRSPKELVEVKKIIISKGLIRSATFKIWLMVEIPANVILLENFIDVGIDGVSIGSNDLTMLMLGADRDNSELATVFDERNPAVLWAFEKTIKTCHKFGITASICGQAPSVYPDLVEKLIRWGITSVSVNPDAIERTRELIYNTEKKVLKGE